jgi:hypothetical protein
MPSSVFSSGRGTPQRDAAGAEFGDLGIDVLDYPSGLRELSRGLADAHRDDEGRSVALVLQAPGYLSGRREP